VTDKIVAIENMMKVPASTHLNISLTAECRSNHRL
jgi:hypothetical protein